MAKSLRELYEESLTGKFTRVYDVFGSPTTQETVTLAGQTHIPAPVEGDGPFVNFDDGLIRGGLVNAITATALDEVRLGKFLLSTNGVLSLVKQSGLQLSNPNTSYTIATTSSKITNTQLFDYVGPLAAAGGNAFGLHFDRHGLKPTFTNTDFVLGSYLYENTDTFTQEFTSRLSLYKDKMDGFPGGGWTLYEYNGGPDSYLGVGKTKRTVESNSLNRKDFSTNRVQGKQSSLNGFNQWSYEKISKYSTEQSKFSSEDYYSSLDIEASTGSAVYPLDFTGKTNYPKYNIHKRIGVTSNNANIGSPNTVDSINMLTITPRSTFYYNSNSAKEAGIQDISQIYTGLFDKNETAAKIAGNYGRDIIKFRIEFLNNDTPVWPLQTLGTGDDKIVPTPNTDVLAFRAYLDNISDNFTSNWKEFNYMGRGESFYTYENFKRDINFSFVLFAHSAVEMPAIYTKLNYLMSNMAPDYTSTGQMRGNYAYLTIGDYIYQQPGVFTSLNVSELLTAPWEISLNEPELRATNLGDAYQHEVPKYLKVQMQFKPIHNFLPKKNKRDKEHTATFITPNFRQGHPNHYLPQSALTVKTDANGKSTKTVDTRIGINARPPYPNPTSTNPLDLA